MGAVVGLELSSVLFVAVTEGDPLGYVAGKASYCLFPVEGIGSDATGMFNLLNLVSRMTIGDIRWNGRPFCRGE